MNEKSNHDQTRPPSREELIQRILAALETAPYLALHSAAALLE